MYLRALATANPTTRLTQPECWEILRNSQTARRLRSRSLQIVESVLTGEHGIDTRHFAIDPIERAFDLNPEELNREFELSAPRLGEQALSKALAEADWNPGELDALLVCTCTGYLCPGISSFLAESLALRDDVVLQDLVGHGCGAAIPTLRAASHLLAANPEARVAVVAVEICSAAFYLDDDPGVLISACLFADGAAATLWSGEPGDGAWQATQFQSLHIPRDREFLRFENRGGFLRNRLHRSVPERAAAAVHALYPSQANPPVDAIVVHPGGRDVLAAITQRIPQHSLESSATVLRRYGNMSSPSILFALQQHLNQTDSPRHLWISSFGAGFTCFGFQLSKTIDLKPSTRRGAPG